MQLTVPLSWNWHLFGEIDWSRGRDCRDCDPVYTDLAGLAGVRFNWRPRPRVSPFAQLLVGRLHSKGEGYAYDTVVGPRYQEPYTADYTAVQPGIGLNVMVTPLFGVRVQADAQIGKTEGYEGVSIFPALWSAESSGCGSADDGRVTTNPRPISSTRDSGQPSRPASASSSDQALVPSIFFHDA